jgi:hypothetical protein
MTSKYFMMTSVVVDDGLNASSASRQRVSHRFQRALRSKRFSRNGHEIEPQPAHRKIVLPPWTNR